MARTLPGREGAELVAFRIGEHVPPGLADAVVVSGCTPGSGTDDARRS